MSQHCPGREKHTARLPPTGNGEKCLLGPRQLQCLFTHWPGRACPGIYLTLRNEGFLWTLDIRNKILSDQTGPKHSKQPARITTEVILAPTQTCASTSYPKQVQRTCPSLTVAHSTSAAQLTTPWKRQFSTSSVHSSNEMGVNFSTKTAF